MSTLQNNIDNLSKISSKLESFSKYDINAFIERYKEKAGFDYIKYLEKEGMLPGTIPSMHGMEVSMQKHFHPHIDFKERNEICEQFLLELDEIHAYFSRTKKCTHKKTYDLAVWFLGYMQDYGAHATMEAIRNAVTTEKYSFYTASIFFGYKIKDFISQPENKVCLMPLSSLNLVIPQMGHIYKFCTNIIKHYCTRYDEIENAKNSCVVIFRAREYKHFSKHKAFFSEDENQPATNFPQLHFSLPLIFQKPIIQSYHFSGFANNVPYSDNLTYQQKSSEHSLRNFIPELEMDILEARKIIKSLEESWQKIEIEHRRKISMALNFYCEALSYTEWEMRCIGVARALEFLLLEDDERDELAKKFRTRGAHLLRKESVTNKVRKENQNALKLLYDARSQAIHSGRICMEYKNEMCTPSYHSFKKELEKSIKCAADVLQEIIHLGELYTSSEWDKKLKKTRRLQNDN